MLTDISFIDIFLRTTLKIANPLVVALLILTGFIFLNKKAFGRAFLIYAFVIIFCPFLKALFKAPPTPTVGTGWAFPSGHMMTLASLWIWLAWEYKNKFLSIFTALMLTSYGVALVYFDYHYPWDIAGALFFSLLTLSLYNFIITRPYTQKNPPIIGFILAAIAIPIMSFTPNGTKLLHIWVGFGSLIGFATGWLINNKFSPKTPNPFLSIKIVIFVLNVLGLIGIKILFSLLQTKTPQTQAIQYFIVTLWLTSIPQCLVYWLCKKIIWAQNDKAYEHKPNSDR